MGGLSRAGHALRDRSVPADPLSAGPDSISATLDILRVFVGEDGGGGNPLGVFLDGSEVPEGVRQAVAADLGYSETVFVDDAESGAVRIFTPGMELPFAGHPMVGTAWLLAQEGRPVRALRAPAGVVPVRELDRLTWIGGRPEWSPPFEQVQLGSPSEVDALSGAPEGLDAAYCWAWEDEARGIVRARAFFNEAGIAEDEATGSAAIALSGSLERALEIHQGVGSLLLTQPLGDGMVEVGGRTELVERRAQPLPS